MLTHTWTHAETCGHCGLAGTRGHLGMVEISKKFQILFQKSVYKIVVLVFVLVSVLVKRPFGHYEFLRCFRKGKFF